MPEAAVHKEGDLFWTKDKVWRTEKSLVASPAGDVIPAQRDQQPHLRPFIPRSPNFGHYEGSLSLRENIRHSGLFFLNHLRRYFFVKILRGFR